MAIIDDKVVAMTFEGSKFNAGVQVTLSALDKLKNSLKFDGATKGFDNLNRASQKVTLGGVVNAVDKVRGKLEALRLVAISVLGQIATRAITAGTQFAKSFTVGPLIDGFHEYATNLNAIQTILANTQASGANLKDVNAALDELNRYSDKTIYNFSEMAKNIGTFTAAGVDLKTSTDAIKGIANLAALSGSNSEQASTAMYQLSQALSAGSVKLQDWNSVVNAGMGGTVFQRALAQTAVSMGTLKDNAVKLTGPMKNVSIHGESFRNSLSTPGKASWLTSDVLTKTLKQFTGDLTDAQLKAQGFNDTQIKAIQQTAKTAMHAATEVKTLSQVLDVAKETAGSGWAKTWQIVFGNFVEAKTTFTALSNTINGFINASSDARNKVLGDWKALGGRTVLIDSIKTAFKALIDILRPIKEAFRDIFPAKTGKDLYNLTLRFQQLAEALKPSPATVEAIRSTFRGLFAVLDIGIQIVKGIFTMFGQLFHSVGGGNGSFLKFTGSIGDFLVALDQALKKGDVFNKFFVKMGAILSIPLTLIQNLGKAISEMFSGFSPGGFSGKMSSATKSLDPFWRMVHGISLAMENLGPALTNAVSNINFEAILQVIRTGLFAGLVLMIRNFIGGTSLKQIFGIMGKNFGRSIRGGVLGNLQRAFGGLTGTLSAMQNELKARTLEEIAIAIALLAASVLALSLVNPDRLGSALGAMTVMFAELLGAMAIMDKITSMTSFIKLPFIAASLILLATAIDLLTLSVLALSRLSWEQLSKGLVGVGVLLGTLAAASVILSKNSAGMIRSSIGIMGIAIAMKILASAMADFGQMKWSEIGKGVAGVVGSLAGIAVAMQIMPKNLMFRSIGILAIAAALHILADAIGKFGAFDWRTIGKGMVGIAGSLTAIALAMQLMPKNMIFMAIGLIGITGALLGIAKVVKAMAIIPTNKLARGLIGFGGALVILAMGLKLMAGSVGGATALAIAGVGLSLLVPTIIALGKQSWGTILKGLVALAAALAVLGVAITLLTPTIPFMLGFGAALLLVGAGLALAGAGIALVGIGLSAIAVSGTAAVGILLKALTDLVKSLVDIAKNLVLGVLEIVKTFAATAPQFVDALVKIINSLLDVVIKSTPKIGQAFQALLDLALKILHDNQAKIIQAGFDLLLALLRGISNNINKVVTAVTDIIVKFLGTLSNNLNRISTAGTQFLIALVKGILQNIASVPIAVLKILTSFLNAIATNLGKVVTAGLSIVVKLLQGIASKVSDIIKAGTDIIVHLITGIGNAGSRIVTAGVNAMIKFINAVSKGSVKLIDAGMKAIINFMNGVAKAIRANTGEFQAAGRSIAMAIADGMSFGLASRAAGLAKQAAGIGHSIWGAMKSAVGAKSPSKRTYEIGQYIMQGLSNGMSESMQQVLGMANSIGSGLISAFKNVFQITSPSKVMEEIGHFVGQGFAKGLRGSTDDIKGAFEELNKEIEDGLKKAREAKDSGAIAVLTAAHNTLTKTLKDEKQDLIALSIEYTNVANKLTAAKDVLANAIKTRNDAQKSFSDQYSTLPDLKFTDSDGNPIDPATVVSTYLEDLKGQSAAVGAYNSTLQQLRKLGLDDATYEKLLREGTADQSFANQLLAGGKTAVDGLNALDKQLQTVSGTLSVNASKNLYQAGVNAAQGVVSGLESKREAIKKKMTHIAQDIIATLKHELKIKSPSQALAEIGAYAMEGFAVGIFDNVKVMRNAVEDAANEAMTALRASMRKVSNVVGDELNASPVITPILDLSRIRQQGRAFADLTSGTSFDQAVAISTQTTAAQDAAAMAAASAPSITFEQNNYSPEALSEIEIYRQTSNQLSQLKSVLAV